MPRGRRLETISKTGATPPPESAFEDLSYRSRAKALLEISGEIRTAISNLRQWPAPVDPTQPATCVRRLAADQYLETAMQQVLKIEDLARRLLNKTDD